MTDPIKISVTHKPNIDQIDRAVIVYIGERKNKEKITYFDGGVLVNLAASATEPDS